MYQLNSVAKSILLAFLLFFSSAIFGQSTTFKKGSVIIDMGGGTGPTPAPTVANSLKPYGLIYNLLSTQYVPVYSVINSSKTKDGIDFTYNGKEYKGGPFVIPGEFITPAVKAVLDAWDAKGVDLVYTTSALTVPVSYKLGFTPKWALDFENGKIAKAFLDAAEIPSAAYIFKYPSELDGCDDIFVMPHADPEWDLHGNLYAWNKDNMGAIWAGCHAVSVLESVTDPSKPSVKLNFLSKTSLVNYKTPGHSGGVLNYIHSLPTDPVAQYLGITDGAQRNGSEQVYMPMLGGGWNTNAKIITQSNIPHPDVPELSPGPVAVNIYGRGFDDPNRGYVMYQGGHDIGGTTAPEVAAQRIFFNFSFFALKEKLATTFNVTLTGIPTEMVVNRTYTGLTAAVGGTGTGTKTYEWRSSVPGTFSAPTASTTSFTPTGTVTSSTEAIITCIVKDDCSRGIFESNAIVVLPEPTVTATGTLTPFSTCVGTASTAQNFTVSGTQLSADITVAAPAGYEVSLSSASGYASTITITQTGGTVSSTTVYVRLSASATNGASGNVVVSSANATSKNVATGTAVVGAVPSVSVSASATTIAPGATTTLTASGAGSYSWSPVTGLSATTGAEVTATLTSTITYSVTGTNTPSCSSTASITITVLSNLDGGVIADNQTICAGTNAVSFTSSSSATGGLETYTYQWQLSTDNTVFTDIASATAETYNPGPVSVTSYYKRKVTDGSATASSNTVKVTVNPLPAAPVIDAAGPTTFCDGGNVVLSASVAASYQWYKNASIITGATAQTYTATASGSYTVIVTDGNGCTSNASAATVVTVNPIPAAPAAITGKVRVIAGTTQTYTATAVPGATTYNWTLPNGWTGTSTSTTINVKVGTISGTISVTASANGCTGAPATLAVVIVPDYDGDGFADEDDLDDDNDGILDTFENAICTPSSESCDTDNDGIPNKFDLESDGDGIRDVIEADGQDTDKDGRADGAVDANGVPLSAKGGLTPPDTDKDGKPDPYDLDSDGDKIPDNVEGQGAYVKPLAKDTDKDGIDDAYDKDNGGTPIDPVDTDKDGKPDYRELDSDADGIPDAVEAVLANSDPATPVDTDKDGVPDYRDLDSDGDKIPDAVEAVKGNSDPATPVDTDKDGTPDYRDLDSDNDTIPDAVEAIDGNTDPAKPVDTDKDGDPDYRDLDADGDSIPDVDEAGPNPNTPVDTDTDTKKDFRDTDSNSDGVPDGETLLIWKTATVPKLSPDGTMLMSYTIIVTNARKEPLTNVQVKEDFTKTFPLPVSFTVLDVKSSGVLVKAAGFDGRANTNLLAAGVTLPGNGQDSLVISLRIAPNGYTGDVNNLADGSATSKWGPVSRQSIDITKSNGRKHGAGLPTVSVIPVVNIIIPDVITPNNDGFNDRLVIQKPSNVVVGLTIYNRWGQMLYKVADYKNDWEGTGKGFLGNRLPNGTYYYLVELSGGTFSTKEVKKGFLTLRRD